MNARESLCAARFSLDSSDPQDRRVAIERAGKEAEQRAPIIPVLGLGYAELGDLAYDGIYDAASDHAREHLGREPLHDETMEIVAAVYGLLNAPIFGLGQLDLRDPIYVGWARFSTAIALEASNALGWVSE